MSLFAKKGATGAVEGGNVVESKPRNKGAKRAYGIAETTLLMRTLPVDQNVELVVRVVRNTLESMDVKLPDIIEDAQQREAQLQTRMDMLNGEIAEFTRQIDLRREEIARLQGELSETSTVKDRLLLAQKLAAREAPLRAEPTAPGKPAPDATTPPPLPRGLANKPPIEIRELAR